MNDTKAASGNGIGFTGLLTILFIGLKLTGHITWSWVWVLSPIWISLGAVLTIFALMLLVIGVIATLDWLGSRRRRKMRLTIKKGRMS